MGVWSDLATCGHLVTPDGVMWEEMVVVHLNEDGQKAYLK